MLKFLPIVACVGLVLTLNPSIAQDRKSGADVTAPRAGQFATKKLRPPTGSVANPLNATTVAPLTVGECTTLGGKEVAESVCNSGKACETTTEDGDWKRVCLSKAQ